MPDGVLCLECGKVERYYEDDWPSDPELRLGQCACAPNHELVVVVLDDYGDIVNSTGETPHRPKP